MARGETPAADDSIVDLSELLGQKTLLERHSQFLAQASSRRVILACLDEMCNTFGQMFDEDQDIAWLQHAYLDNGMIESLLKASALSGSVGKKDNKKNNSTNKNIE